MKFHSIKYAIFIFIALPLALGFAETEATDKRTQLNQALDAINGKFGDFTVAPMRVIGRSEMPNVIAPAWKPTGHRKTI